jgi:hypothetical protein
MNATDLTTGSVFSFTQDSFDRICSDLDPIPVARAVLASSAYPVAFSPITLKNYGHAECDYYDPQWVTDALNPHAIQYAISAHESYPDANEVRGAQVWKSYGDTERRPYIHLTDGSPADNIGLLGPDPILKHIAVDMELRSALLDMDRPPRIAVIVVDATKGNNPEVDKSPRPPGILSMIQASVTNPIGDSVRTTLSSWFNFMEQLSHIKTATAAEFENDRSNCDNLARNICQHSGDPNCQKADLKQCYEDFDATDEDEPKPGADYYYIVVQPDRIYTEPDIELLNTEADPDLINNHGITEQERIAIQKMPTTMQLPKRDIDQVIRAAHEILHHSPNYQRLIADLKEDAARTGPKHGK